MISEFIDIVTENFFDPQKRVFIGYLLSAILISFLWLFLVKKENIKSTILKIFDKNIFMSKSAKTDYLLFTTNIIILMFLSPLLITQLAIANLVFEQLHSQAILRPMNINSHYTWLLPYFFTLTYFIFDDFTKYITHTLMHKIPILWEFHKTHHTARTLTPLTIFRTHPIEGLIFILRSAITQGVVIAIFYYVYGNNITLVTILGANIFSFWFHLLGSNLRHSHIRINYWNWLEKILISPAQHQIHHSIKEKHYNKNFGVTFAIWDYFFGSLYISNNNEHVYFGISKKIHKYENNIIFLYVTPLIRVYIITVDFFKLKYMSVKKQKLILNK